MSPGSITTDAPVLDYSRPPRVRRWRAVWQLPLLWFLPAATATGWVIANGANAARQDWFVSLTVIGTIVPLRLGVRHLETRLLLGLLCASAAFAFVGLLFDMLVEYRATDTWWDRHWTLSMAAAFVALAVLLNPDAYTFKSLCTSYVVGLVVQAGVMLLMSAVWGVWRAWQWLRGGGAT